MIEPVKSAQLPGYLLVTFEDENVHRMQSPAQIAALISARAKYLEQLRSGGQLRACGHLRPSAEGHRLSAREQVRTRAVSSNSLSLASYHWLAVDTLEEAVALAKNYPMLHTDVIDVRSVKTGHAVAIDDALPGKLVACVVLGSEENEPAWESTMERIDQQTRGQFPDGLFVAGVRLERPSEGKRLAMADEKRVVLDGPFIESKELIGGVCVLRAGSLEQVLAWAGQTAFVTLGTLEVRELWRI